MSKKKTLFKKYLRTSMAIVTVSFLILGLTTFVFVTDYWKKERNETFLRNAGSVSSVVANNGSVVNGSLSLINGDVVEIFVDVLASNMNADVFVTDIDGKVILYSGPGRERYVEKKIPPEVTAKALKGEYSGSGKLGGVYDSERYVVGTPITVPIAGSDTAIGAVFAAVDSGPFLSFKANLLKTFLASSLAALLVSFWVARRFSYRMVKPLGQASEAAAGMAGGDFSKRVAYEGEDEIGELAKAFNDMASSLEASESVRRSFIANVSHEFKTPMTTIAGFVDGILDGTIPEEGRERYLKIVSSEIKRLSRLVKTMLDLSRIDGGGFRASAKRFNLTDVVLKVLPSFESRIARKKINASIEGDSQPVFIVGDRDMIYQATYNLIENAVKFTDVSGYIKIGILNGEGVCRLYVENSGEGISKEEIRFVFDRFYKADKSRSKDKNGMGLGLYIAKKITNLHGGDVKAFSVPGKYTRFELWFRK